MNYIECLKSSFYHPRIGSALLFSLGIIVLTLLKTNDVIFSIKKGIIIFVGHIIVWSISSYFYNKYKNK